MRLFNRLLYEKAPTGGVFLLGGDRLKPVTRECEKAPTGSGFQALLEFPPTSRASHWVILCESILFEDFRSFYVSKTCCCAGAD